MSRFPVLRTIAYLLKGFAVLAVLIGLLVALTQDGGAMKIAFLGGALLNGLVLWAFSELISVALSIESNTYLTQQSLAGVGPSASKSLPPLSKPDVPSKAEPGWSPAPSAPGVSDTLKTPALDRLP